MSNPLPTLPKMTAPVFHILLALADEERHGYGIILEIERRKGSKDW